MAGIQNARMVGYALATIKDGSNVPWFRVINSQGKISFPEESDGFKIQHSLLLKEGIIFDVKNRINLKQFGWNEANE